VTEYLDLDDLLAAADAAVGGSAQIRDVGLLQAAAARPKATVFGEDAYRSLDDKAAALLHSLVTGHPLIDGNKRLGWVALRLFYLLNGADVHPDPVDAFAFVSAVANGTLRDVAPIAEQLAAWRTKTETRRNARR
jgi:death on curing protein